MSSSSGSRTFVLVHGAFADHRAFDAVRPLLEAAGHRAIGVALPGHGDATPPREVGFDHYVATVRRAIEDAADPVVLVAHSMAGMVASQVAEALPHRIAKLIYVAAYLPVDGQNLQALAEHDSESLVGQSLEFAPDYTTVTVRRDRIVDAIGADLPPPLQAMLAAGHPPEPLGPFQSTVHLTRERFGAVPKAYVRTSLDRAVTPALQAKMLAAYPDVPTATLATSHLPFLARPAEFVETIVRLAE